MRRWLAVFLLSLALLSAEPASAIVTYQYTHISTNTTTVVRVGRGTLFAVVINTRGTTANTATIYDNVVGSGTVIGVIDTTASVGTILYNVRVDVGITVVTATGGAADLTIASD